MFSPWQYNLDKVAKSLLEQTGWIAPNLNAIPTGSELVQDYLLPLSNLPEISNNLHLNTQVVGVVRKSIDKLKTSKRQEASIEIYVEKEEQTSIYEVRAVIDASGTWRTPNPVLSNGLWTKAEKNLKGKIEYGIPNVLGDHKEKYANKTVMVVGSGHSAINALLDLSRLKEEFTETNIIWVLRKSNISQVYGGQEKDGLPARGELGIRIRKMVESGAVKVFTPFHINTVKQEENHVTVKGIYNSEETIINSIDQLIVSTGFRPDTSFLNEVRINLDPAVESVEALAPLIDPNVHSCGTVRPHGEAELRQPEAGLYIVGMKSYGRAPTFLLATGYEQVRSVVAYLTGDLEGAKEVHLELPETGVCSVGVSSCCDEPAISNVNTCDTEKKGQVLATSSCCGPIKIEIEKTSCCK
ncbi:MULTISPECIES: NAD(P)-binding domain-containing protein [Robertmurraya]|uniref:NAD(P)-binding domain-containing protein n=1 Tax=Robertmurraya beringensis TaxID=641660 RepID=A0ABV6KUI6_9BACI